MKLGGTAPDGSDPEPQPATAGPEASAQGSGDARDYCDARSSGTAGVAPGAGTGTRPLGVTKESPPPYTMIHEQNTSLVAVSPHIWPSEEIPPIPSASRPIFSVVPLDHTSVPLAVAMYASKSPRASRLTGRVGLRAPGTLDWVVERTAEAPAPDLECGLTAGAVVRHHHAGEGMPACYAHRRLGIVIRSIAELAEIVASPAPYLVSRGDCASEAQFAGGGRIARPPAPMPLNGEFRQRRFAEPALQWARRYPATRHLRLRTPGRRRTPRHRSGTPASEHRTRERTVPPLASVLHHG